MKQGKDEEEEKEEEEGGEKETLADLLQVLVVLQLVHQLAVQVVADLLRSALRGREGDVTAGRPIDAQPSLREGTLTKASGPSSMLLLVQGFQLTCGGDQGTTPLPL